MIPNQNIRFYCVPSLPICQHFEVQTTVCGQATGADPAAFRTPGLPALGHESANPVPWKLLTLCCLIHPRHSLVRHLVNSSHPELLWQVYPPPPLELGLRTRGTLMAL